MNIMGSSIQDYLKKINSRLSLLNCVSLFVTTLFLLLFITFLYIKTKKVGSSVEYIENKDEIVDINRINNNSDSHPFASINGKTYTYSWCQGASMISEKNKIYFNTEIDAQNSGRALSKLCKK